MQNYCNIKSASLGLGDIKKAKKKRKKKKVNIIKKKKTDEYTEHTSDLQHYIVPAMPPIQFKS